MATHFVKAYRTTGVSTERITEWMIAEITTTE